MLALALELLAGSVGAFLVGTVTGVWIALRTDRTDRTAGAG